LHDLAHQAIGNDRFAVEPDRLLRIGKAEAGGIAFVDPDDARVGIDDQRAFAEILERLE
jgi:hypothetical protein